VVFDERSSLGLVRLRAFGNYTFRVTEPQLFINTCAAGDDSFTTDEIGDFLRDVIVSRLNDILGENLKSVFDLAGNYDELSEGMTQRLAEDFSKYGLEIGDFYVQAITPPAEVQKAIDERSAMGALGDLNKYMKFKAARAIGDAANNPGGMAGAGVGMGVGMGMGAMLPGMIVESMRTGEGSPPPQEAGVAIGSGLACTKCHNEIPKDARFCHHCGGQVVVQQRCPDCSTELPVEAKFCFGCGGSLARTSGCNECGRDVPKGAKFCFHCGAKMA
jgi:membrane protease subunit (stomatin/prohibitin family)